MVGAIAVLMGYRRDACDSGNGNQGFNKVLVAATLLDMSSAPRFRFSECTAGAIGASVPNFRP
jgi:hypothetical protein